MSQQQERIHTQSKLVYYDIHCVSEYIQKVDYFYGKTLEAIMAGDPDEAERQTINLAQYAQMMSRRVRWAALGLSKIDYCDQDQIQFEAQEV